MIFIGFWCLILVASFWPMRLPPATPTSCCRTCPRVSASKARRNTFIPLTDVETDLVGGLEHVLFFHILGIIIPTDFHIVQRGRAQPPTREDVKSTCICLWSTDSTDAPRNTPLGERPHSLSHVFINSLGSGFFRMACGMRKRADRVPYITMVIPVSLPAIIVFRNLFWPPKIIHFKFVG